MELWPEDLRSLADYIDELAALAERCHVGIGVHRIYVGEAAIGFEVGATDGGYFARLVDGEATQEGE